MEKIIFRFLKNINNIPSNIYFSKKNTIDWSNINTTCQADGLIYHNLNKYICTHMLIDVEGFDSDIRNMEHGFSTCQKADKNFIMLNF